MRQRDFERSVGDKLMPHMEQGANCRSVMGWPEDDVSKWVSSHRDETKNVICHSLQGKNLGFCGTTRSRTRTRSTGTGPMETKGAEMGPGRSRKARVGAKETARGKTTRKSA